MKAQKAPSKPPGRPKGSLNKSTLDFKEKLEAHGFDVAATLIFCCNEAMTTYSALKEEAKGCDERREALSIIGTAATYLKVASDTARDMAHFSYPRLKSIEFERVNPLSDMSPEMKLEMMKQAVIKGEQDLKTAKARGAKGAEEFKNGSGVV
jgi:hypothetical protein